MSDYADALVGYLRDVPTVAALAGANVFPAELPADLASSMPGCAVVVNPLGGGRPASNEQLRQARVDVTCYGATPKQARALWLAVELGLQELHRAAYAGCMLYVGVLLSGPIQTRHPETHWPMVWGSWQVTAGTQDI